MRILASRQAMGDDRRDLGLLKAVLALLVAQGVKFHDIVPDQLLPNPPPRREQTLEEEVADLEAFSKRHNQTWQSNPSAG